MIEVFEVPQLLLHRYNAKMAVTFGCALTSILSCVRVPVLTLHLSALGRTDSRNQARYIQGILCNCGFDLRHGSFWGPTGLTVGLGA